MDFNGVTSSWPTSILYSCTLLSVLNWNFRQLNKFGHVPLPPHITPPWQEQDGTYQWLAGHIEEVGNIRPIPMPLRMYGASLQWKHCGKAFVPA